MRSPALVGVCVAAMASVGCLAAAGPEPFPANVPPEKPTDRPLSAAVERLYDQWHPLGDRANDLYRDTLPSPAGEASRPARSGEGTAKDAKGAKNDLKRDMK